MSQVIDVATYLAANGHGTLKTAVNDPSSWPIYRFAIMPGSVDQQIVVLASPGMGATEAMSELVANNPGLQVIVRDAGAESAETKACAIYEELRATKNTAINGGAVYHDIRPMARPFVMGRDHEGRFLWSCNYLISVAS